MSETSSLLIIDTRSSLQRTLARRPQGDLAVLFANWILAETVYTEEAARLTFGAAQRTGAQLDFPTVAALGYARDSGVLGPEISPALRQGLERLGGRQPFVDGNPMAFCSDAVGILGVALGAKLLADNAVLGKITSWLSVFMHIIYDLGGTENWQRHFFCAADGILGGGNKLIAPPPEQAADAYLSLSAKNLLVPVDGIVGERVERQALRLLLDDTATELPFERAAMRLASLQHIIRTAPAAVPGRIGLPDLVRLLARVPAALRKWTWETRPRTINGEARLWHIDNEYHLQNLLWAILAPIFPDLDDEQYLAKIGQKSPRADLHIPSMKVIIEAKFLRRGESMQKVIDEISSDTGLYNAMGNNCAGIIPVVWDDGARSHEHDYLRNGLKRLPTIIDAIVIPRPGWIAGATTVPVPAKKNERKQGKQT